MKKVFMILLAVVMLVSVMPLSASASSVSDRERTIEMACELFPEHVSVIRNEAVNIYERTSPIQKSVKIFEETRYYSDNTALTLTEFSDGTAYIAKNGYERIIEDKDSEVDGNLVHYTIDITVYPTFDEDASLNVYSIKCIIDSLWYDNIVDEGALASDLADFGYVDDNKFWEDRNGSAYTSYYAKFPQPDGSSKRVTAKFKVGNDACRIELSVD